MTTAIPATERALWQVPSYSTTFWNGRSRPHCVVIPVINEGERILNLLRRMAAVRIADIADVIIVDGGSTDGSLEPQRLQELGVRGLLVKTAPGKLSAQLRCAYAFVLDEGYTGIVTIDGNDKDDPDALPRFIEAIGQGYDFVQASRQGFRAYSRAMLLDPRVAPFRDDFTTYELLAYLSYRVPKLGYRCVELPTVRRYPKGEVPTKISSVRGNLSVLQVLMKACAGHYNPRLGEDAQLAAQRRS